MSSDLPSGWIAATVGEVAEVVGGGTPKTSVDEYWDGEFGWLTPKDLRGYGARHISAGERSITRLGLENSSARLLPPGTVLVSSRAPIGYVALAGAELSTNQGFKSLVLKPGHLPEFYYYVMTTKKSAMEAVAGGSTFKEISGRVMKTISVPVPPIQEQCAIAEVLGALDDRIEWCRDGQALLRSLLHARFQRDFRVGRSVRLGDVTETVPGRSYKSADLDDDSPVGLVNLKNIPRHGGFNPIGVKGYTGAYRPAQVVRQGELVVACTDMTQQGDVIGRVGRVRPNPAYPTMVISMDMAAVRPVVPWLSSEYLAEVLSTREYVDHAKRYVNGTTVLHMKKVAVAEYETELPEPDAVAAFTEFARPMWERHDLLDDEAHALTQLRDTLLPKLLSGELRIENPERLLEGVA